MKWLWAALGAAFFICTQASAATCVNITGALVDGALAPFNGTLTIALTYSTAASPSTMIVQGNITQPVKAGVFAKCLYPGTYQVTYQPSNGTQFYQRFWTVPVSGDPLLLEITDVTLQSLTDVLLSQIQGGTVTVPEIETPTQTVVPAPGFPPMPTKPGCYNLQVLTGSAAWVPCQ